ncbi:hypothetical protein AAG906_007177 [Vitis piasezkii]
MIAEASSGKGVLPTSHMAYPPCTPTFIPKAGFPQDLEDYVSHFKINPQYHRFIESASYDKVAGKWHIVAKNTLSNEWRDFMHCSNYKNGKRFTNKKVLVVGCGNSGIEIAYDLWDHGAITSIVVRNPVMSLFLHHFYNL